MAHDFEDVVLEWDGGSGVGAGGGAMALGDHYGDSQCAVIAPARGWCVVGGEGLEVWRFGGAVTPGDPPRLSAVARAGLWRRESAPPDGARCWFVGALDWPGEGDVVRVVAEVAGGVAATFEVDVLTLAWRRTSS